MTQLLSRQPKEKRRLAAWLAWWPVALLLIFLTGLYILSNLKTEAVANARRSQRKEGPPPINVVTLTLAPSVIKDRITLPGEVLANQELDVPSEISAILLKKTRKEGEAIVKGEVLAQLDGSRYAARLQAAEAAFKTANASAQRMKSLNRTNLATQSNLDLAVANLEEARSTLTAARLDLSKCEIKAPFSGYLDAYLIDEGTFVTTGSPVCRLVDLRRVKIRVGVPESDVTGARAPASFSVFIDALGDQPIPGGTLSRVARVAGNMARLYDLEILLPNEEGLMVPDMFARVVLVKELRAQALVVPLYTVISRGDRHMVFVEVDGKAVIREVKTGIQEGWMVEVTEGLSPGDQVIVVGQRSVSEGRKVTVVRRAKSTGDLLP
jgi:membrane fusion protein (multidrug efflux system)